MTDLLKVAIDTLADADDGARKIDGVGFSKSDTQFGNSLAAAEYWTPKQRIAAYNLAQRYRRQLTAAGIDLASIPDPSKPDAMRDDLV